MASSLIFFFAANVLQFNIINCCCSTQHVRDIDWLDPHRVVVALNQKLGIVVLGENQTLNEIVLFPDFHTDTIRELAVNPKVPHLVISGGFDGNVFVTDISRLVDDIQRNEKKSENSVYLCKDVVGSVNWHPNDHNVASCTTDLGVLHVFDIRTDQSKPAFVYDTQKIELYAHSYVDDFTLCLGYGDGTIAIHDIRFGKPLVSFKDPCVHAVGDLVFADSTSTKTKKMAVFGVPEMSIWRFSSNPSSVECVYVKYCCFVFSRYVFYRVIVVFFYCVSSQQCTSLLWWWKGL